MDDQMRRVIGERLAFGRGLAGASLEGERDVAESAATPPSRVGTTSHAAAPPPVTQPAFTPNQARRARLPDPPSTFVQPAGVASKHVMQIWGKGDTFSPESTMNNTGLAAGMVAAFIPAMAILGALVPVHRLLQQRLDRNVTGAPETPVFMQILKLLFSPADAEIARQMPTNFTKLTDLARKLNMPADELLDILSGAQVKATFFVLGRAATAYPEVVRREAELGMAIGDHTWNHRDMRRLDAGASLQELTTTRDLVEQISGTKVTLMRPPYGAYDDAALEAAADCGADYVVMWSVSQPGRYLRYLDGGSRLRPGDILLTHFGEHTAEYLERTLKMIQARGFTTGRLEDYLPARGA